MPLKITGVDDIRRNINNLTDRTNGDAEPERISYTELFPDPFVANHSDFETFQAMIDACGIERAEELDGEAWSAFVAGHSRFTGWEDMVVRAYAALIARKLGL